MQKTKVGVFLNTVYLLNIFAISCGWKRRTGKGRTNSGSWTVLSIAHL